ncbi:MAG: tetratricopeptide repeat protein [Thermoanaerobaculaceae bacterium]
MLTFVLIFLLAGVQPPVEEAKAALAANDYPRAKVLLEALAKKGDPQGQYLLGHLLDLGLGVEADPRAALNWWLAAAAARHPQALYRAGLAYLHGRGVDPDASRGLELLEEAALLGVHEAETAIGLALFNNIKGPGHVPEAMVWLSCAAEAGDRQAAETLGLIYAKGTDETMPDGLQAVRYLRLAEKLGSGMATKVLVELDPAAKVKVVTEENVHLLWEAARMGFPDAQFRLAVLGLARVPWGPSRSEAKKLLETAVANGHAEAAYRLLLLRRHEGPVPSPVEVEALLRQAALGGFTPAALELGSLLTARRSPEALRWLRTALQAGHLWAALDLAEASFTGLAGATNPEEGLKILASLLNAQDPELKKRAAQLLLRYRHDENGCEIATKLDPTTVCQREKTLSSGKDAAAPSQKP